MAKGRITVAMLFLLSALSASADDNVTVVTASGETPYAMESISRIDFSETDITVVAQDKEGVTYAFDEIRKIVFTTTPAGIEPMTAAQKSKLTLTVADGGRSITVSEWNGTAVDVSSLPHGIYVLKAGSETAKFRK